MPEKAVGGEAVSLGGNYFTGFWIFAVVANLCPQRVDLVPGNSQKSIRTQSGECVGRPGV